MDYIKLMMYIRHQVTVWLANLPSQGLMIKTHDYLNICKIRLDESRFKI